MKDFWGCALGVSALLALTWSVAEAAPAGLPKGVRQDIDAIGQETIRSGASAGLAIGVVRDGKLVFSGYYGKSNLELGTPVTAGTVFRIASMTKMFTSAAINLLVERHRLSLDDHLDKYIPTFPRAGEVTIRELLNHTSGIHNFTEPGRTTPPGKMGGSPAQFLEYLSHMDPVYDYDPGTHWWYSNTGYVLLGDIIEKVTGTSYHDFMQREIFDRVGTRSTAIDRNEDIADQRASGYTLVDDKKGSFRQADYTNMTEPFSAGSIRSSLPDLARLEVALFDGKIVSNDRLKDMTTPGLLSDGRFSTDAVYWPRPDPLPSPPPGYGSERYGLGFQINQLLGHPFVGHNGGIAGFSSISNNYKADNFIVIVLANTDRAAYPVEEKVAKIMFGSAAAPHSQPKH